METERLQKVMAAAGLGSRRKCEAIIDAGRVTVNGQVVDRQGLQVNRATDEIRVDGKLLPTSADLVVLALNKPLGVLSTMSDDRGRPCVGDLVADRPERLFHVGRLDADTTGLLLLTNDGELAQRLTHPKHGVSKTYRATVAGEVGRGVRKRLLDGVVLEDGLAKSDAFNVVTTHGDRSIVQITLHEGRNRIVRRMLAAVGHPVEELTRTQLGPIHLSAARPGQIIELTDKQVRDLYAESDN